MRAGRRWAAGTVAIVVTAAVVACSRTDSDRVAQFRGDAGRTGVYEARDSAPPREALWRLEVPGGVTAAVVADGRIFFEGGDGQLHARDATTGQELWTNGKTKDAAQPNDGEQSKEGKEGKDDKATRSAPPLVVQDRVWWHSQEALISLSVENGSERIRIPNPPVSSLWPMPLILLDGAVYYTSSRKVGNEGNAQEEVSLHAVNEATGLERWRTAVGDSKTLLLPVIASRSLLFVVTVSPNEAEPAEAAVQTVAVNAATGQEVWRRTGGIVLAARPDLLLAVAPPRDVGATESSDAVLLLGLSPTSGQDRWVLVPSSPPGAGTFLHAGAVVADASIFVSGQAIKEETTGSPIRTPLIAIDTRTGQEQWKTEIRGGLEDKALILSGDLLYVGGSDGLIAIDASSGAERWRFRTSEPVWPLSINNGVIYFASDKALYAVR